MKLIRFTLILALSTFSFSSFSAEKPTKKEPRVAQGPGGKRMMNRGKKEKKASFDAAAATDTFYILLKSSAEQYFKNPSKYKGFLKTVKNTHKRSVEINMSQYLPEGSDKDDYRVYTSFEVASRKNSYKEENDRKERKRREARKKQEGEKRFAQYAEMYGKKKNKKKKK